MSLSCILLRTLPHNIPCARFRNTKLSFRRSTLPWCCNCMECKSHSTHLLPSHKHHRMSLSCILLRTLPHNIPCARFCNTKLSFRRSTLPWCCNCMECKSHSTHLLSSHKHHRMSLSCI